MSSRFDRIAERLEQRAEELFAAAARNRRESRLERQLGGREVRLPLASAGKCGVEPTRQHDREQRRCDVRPVVDVLVLRAAFAAAASNHSDWINVEENGGGARFLTRLRVEDRRVAKRELPRVHMLGMLVQQESKIGS